MDGLRRFWSGVLLAGALAVVALVAVRPLLLVGAATLGAFLLATQYRFVRALATVERTLAVEQTVTPAQTTTDDAVTVTLTLERTRPGDERLHARLTPPVGVRVLEPADLDVVLEPGERSAATTVAVEPSVAGRHEFGQPSVTVVDGAQRFRETLQLGEAATLVAQPPVPRSIHVGQGGDDLAAGFGEHVIDRRGAGLEPAELREYQPGDAANRIAWKATARLNEAYVREFEAETDRTFAMVLDARAGMDQGPPGRTKAAFAREVALTVVEHAREAADPVGLYVVDDAGIDTAMQPGATREHYDRLWNRLGRVEQSSRQSAAVESGGPGQGAHPIAVAQRRGARLADDDSAFGRTLRPYFGASDAYVERISADPLFGAVRSRVARLGGTVRTMLFTDDTHPTEVLETAKLARSKTDHVLVFLLPTVLFEPGALADLDAAYERYVAFEAFRRRLDRLEGVSAFEVGPTDRIAAILDTTHDRA